MHKRERSGLWESFEPCKHKRIHQLYVDTLWDAVQRRDRTVAFALLAADGFQCLRSLPDSRLVPLLSLFLDGAPVCPLLLALWLERADLVGMLLKKGANNQRFWYGTNALREVTNAYSPYAENISMRMQALAHFPKRTLRRPQLLINVLATIDENRDLPILQSLMAAKTNVDDVRAGELVPTQIAALYNNSRMLRMLIEAGASVYPVRCISVEPETVVRRLCDPYFAALGRTAVEMGSRNNLDPWKDTVQLLLSAGVWHVNVGAPKVFRFFDDQYRTLLKDRLAECEGALFAVASLVSVISEYGSHNWSLRLDDALALVLRNTSRCDYRDVLAQDTLTPSEQMLAAS